MIVGVVVLALIAGLAGFSAWLVKSDITTNWRRLTPSTSRDR